MPTLRSPPETPSRRAMAVGNENLNSLKSESPRTPLPVRPTKNEKPDKSPSVEKEYEAPGQKIQNPFSQPSNKPPEDSGGQQIGVDEGNHEGKHLQGDQIGETKDIPSDDKLQPLEEEPDIMEQEAVDDNLDLPPFDWVAFREDYGTAIAAADKVEEELGVEFEKVCTAFSIWADTASQHDNERAVKRLKTRERFVQLSEAGFEKKKEHYVEVVEAFKKALALLHG